MATAVETNELARREETTGELQQSQAAAIARYETEGALIVARKFPRNEDKAFQGLMKACGRPTFAADVTYRFPRGGTDVEGPSVYLAKEAARLWGNIQYGCNIISDDEDQRHVRGWAWDVETNARSSADDVFQKLIYRKKGGWQKPDERDLRELTNKRAAILVRNCLLSLLPSDLVEDAIAKAKQTLTSGVKADLDGSRKKVIEAFSQIGVSVDDLEAHLEHKLSQCSPEEIADLRGIWKSISDGNTKWADYSKKETGNGTAAGPVSMDDLTNPKAAKNGSGKKADESNAQGQEKSGEESNEPPDTPAETFIRRIKSKPGDGELLKIKKELIAALDKGAITKEESDQLHGMISESLK